MRLKYCWRGLAPIVLSLLVSACGESESGDEPPASGGKGGAAGKGGSSAGGQSGASGASGQGGAGQGGAGAGGAAGSQAGAGSGGASGAGQGGSAGAAGEAQGGQAGSVQAGQGGSGGSAGGEAGQGGEAGAAGTGGSSGQGGSSAGGAGQGGSGGATGGQGGSAGGPACKPPDMLLVLDRTLTMNATPEGVKPTDAPSYASSKWYQAITAIEQMVTPPADATLRFGLELWPRDPGGGACVTLEQQVTGSKGATNPACEAGEVVVEPALNTGAQIKALLDPATTSLCFSTPTGQALITAQEDLKKLAEPGRDQYVVLVTDGADWANTCPDPDPLLRVQQLKAEGIKTFIVGFSASGASTSGVGLEFLNNMACAGGTAKGFPGTCKQDDKGNFVALDPKASPLFLQAGNGSQLTAALQSVAGSLCCGCETKCDAPDVLFALDRTLTMAATPQGSKATDAPDYQSSKWYQALTGINKVVTSQEQQFRFGLELWPRDPGAGKCVTLEQQVTGSKGATNPACEAGEVVVEPALNTGAAIASKLDPKTATLCFSTPTGEALITASTYLTSHITPGRAQYVVLVTDGADWANTCPDPDPLLRVQQLAASGIKTFIVGFFAKESSPGGVGIAFLNNMACAGQTAKGFAAACKQSESGYVAADPNSTVPLFMGAEDSAQLEGVLVGALDSLGCKL